MAPQPKYDMVVLAALERATNEKLKRPPNDGWCAVGDCDVPAQARPSRTLGRLAAMGLCDKSRRVGSGARQPFFYRINGRGRVQLQQHRGEAA